MVPKVEHAYVRTNDVTLHTVKAGPDDGPLVLLLHGFPEFWLGWRYQIKFLADAGYRVLVPDQRGYNLSDKPEGVAAYRLDELAADALGLIDAHAREDAFLVGHDWGAAVAWWVAARYPQKIDRLIIINVPHPAVLQRTLRRSLKQIFKSWYILFFQLPKIPETVLRLQNWRPLAETLRRSSRPGTFTETELASYREAWSQPGAMTAMLNWYRALVRYMPQPAPNPRVTVPTLLLWGANDVALSRKMAQSSIDLCDEGGLVLFENATHWVQHEEPHLVNGLTHSFLSSH